MKLSSFGIITEEGVPPSTSMFPFHSLLYNAPYSSLTVPDVCDSLSSWYAYHTLSPKTGLVSKSNSLAIA